MGGDNIIEPTPLCQEALWKTVQAVVSTIQHVGDPWFPAAFVFTIMGSSIVVKDASDGGLVELEKGRVTVMTRPCIAVVTRQEIELHECTTARYAKGRWVRFNKYVVPYAEKEYYEAGELYEMLAWPFKAVASRIADIWSS